MSSTHVQPEPREAVLHGLIHTLKDGQHGYEAAARDCTNSDLKHMFSQISRERAAFSLKLATLLGPHQAAPAPALDRGWTHLTSAMADRENMSVLEECERGEAFAATQYGDALLNPNMGNARELIESQSNLIAKSQLRMKSFRDKFNAKPVKQ